MRTQLLPFLLLLCVAGGLSAQGTDRLVLTDGSQLSGRIRFSNPVSRSRSLTISGQDGDRTYAAAEIHSAEISRGSLHLRSVDLSRLSNGIQGLTIGPDRIRLGEVLASGSVSLLKVHLGQEEYPQGVEGMEPYLYLLEWDDRWYALAMTRIEVYGNWHANPARFRNLLKYLTRDCPQALELAASADYKDGALLSVLEAYAACEPEVDITIDARRRRGILAVEHHAQVFNLDSRDADFSNRQLSVGLGYQAVARFTGRYRHLAVLASAQYLYQSFRWREQSDIGQSMVRGNFSLGVTPLRREAFTLQASGGLSNYHAVSSGFRSFFSNHYFMLNGGLTAYAGAWSVGVHYEFMPHQITRRPGNQLLATLGYRVSW